MRASQNRSDEPRATQIDVEALEIDELDTGTDATVNPIVREEPVLHVVEAETAVVEVVEVEHLTSGEVLHVVGEAVHRVT